VHHPQQNQNGKGITAMLEMTDRQWELLREGSHIDAELAKLQDHVLDPGLDESTVARFMTEGVRLSMRLTQIMRILQGLEDDPDLSGPRFADGSFTRQPVRQWS
jgi:hypothetical protein